MYRYTKNLCKKCQLQEDSFHGIKINGQGLCSLCFKTSEPPKRNWDDLQKSFEAKLDNVRGHLPYEGMIMMSGGKDSAYMANLLKKKYGMNLLAFIIDNNYEYPETFDNAMTIAQKLDMPYILYRQNPKLMRQYYKFLFCEETLSQQDCGQVCTFCGRFLVRTATDFARSMGIPLVFSGHNPDQIFLMGESIETDPERLTIMEFTMEMVAENTQKALEAWAKTTPANVDRLFPQILAPKNVELVFPFQHFPYEPEKMMSTVRDELDWLPIKRFSKTYIASGCKLVKLWAYLAHCSNTNSYVDFEFSSQVRNGTLASETVQKFYSETNVEIDELSTLIRELNMTKEMKLFLGEKLGKTNDLLNKL
ncbi:MAG: hypothetical protein JEY79_12420 [Pseudodesulfovibrio sp.]|nr:hypothetical protein [Pseudodesulfovibrio sp.]